MDVERAHAVMEKIACETSAGERVLEVAMTESASRLQIDFLNAVLERIHGVGGRVAVLGKGAEWLAPILSVVLEGRAQVACFTMDSQENELALDNSKRERLAVDVVPLPDAANFEAREGPLSFLLATGLPPDTNLALLSARLLSPGGRAWIARPEENGLELRRYLASAARLGFWTEDYGDLFETRHCHPNFMREFFGALEDLEGPSAWKEIDLSPGALGFEPPRSRDPLSDQTTEWKKQVRLATRVFCETVRHTRSGLPYDSAAGIKMVRHHVARWIRDRYGIMLSARDVVLGPSSDALRGLAPDGSLTELSALRAVDVRDLWSRARPGLVFLGETPHLGHPGATLAFLASKNQTILQEFARFAETRWRRVPASQQFAAEAVLKEFESSSRKGGGLFSETPVNERSPAQTEEASLARGQLPEHASREPPLALDHLENRLPAPSLAHTMLAKSALCRDESMVLAAERASDALARALNLENGAPVVAMGVTPLFRAALECCKEQGGFAVFSHDSSIPLLDFYRTSACTFTQVPSSHASGFRLRLQDMISIPGANAWFFLSAPFSSLGGAPLEADEMAEMSALARHRGQHLVLDATLVGLDFDPEGRTRLLEPRVGPESIVLYGPSRTFSLGGLRMGCAFAGSEDIAASLRRHSGALPPLATLLASEALFSAWSQGDLDAHLDEQRRCLARNCRHLREALARCGWETVAPQGGLCLLAKPSATSGTLITSTQAEDSGENARRWLAETYGICSLGPEAHGVAGYCLLSFSDSAAVAEAARRIDGRP